MSEDFQFDIPFENNQEQQNFRLLEIPSELLGSITSENPPRALFLKSRSQEANGSLVTSQNYAVLCTDDLTFNLRQVHSSNSVHVIAPTEIKANGDIGLTTIAQCTTTLELVPASADAICMLKEALPIYNSSLGLTEQKVGSIDRGKSADRGAKQDLFDNLPLSRHEFENAWLDLCAFEASGHAWIPSAVDCFSIWKSIMSTAHLETADLVEGFNLSTLKQSVIEQDTYPEDLWDAVLRKVCGDPSNIHDCIPALSQDVCVTWVGNLLLETLSSSTGGISETDFLHEWRNSLPEQWRHFASCSELKCKYSRTTNGMLRFGLDEPGNSNSVKPIPGKRLRKWHEKFKNTR